ncbi:TLE family member 2, transcriptional corepressor c isoform X2 [Danio rerio]|uniref:TLE family member 2, transcriptional corepressor c isoform X2 n=1 Tax=Danio rerio TaxID=7955 RepID=A0AC58H5E8_DANRE
MTSRSMYPHGRPQAPLVSGHAGMKFTVLETLDHIKEEFQLFQAQYHSLKLECEKLASEKTEMHRHYIMYYEMSYGLNIEMQKQAEIVKRLSAICTQIIPLLSQEHQHQVAQAVERSKHVSMAELNAIIGQQQFQHLSHHAPGFPMTPHPSGLSLGAGAGLMALPGAFPFPPHLMPKDDLSHPEALESRGTDSHRYGPFSHFRVCHYSWENLERSEWESTTNHFFAEIIKEKLHDCVMKTFQKKKRECKTENGSQKREQC